MRTTLHWSVGLAVALLLAGCGQETRAPGGNASIGPAVAQPALTAWEQKDSSTAVTTFVETDWSRRPLFPSDSPLSLSEEQFVRLSNAERQAKSTEMLAQIDSVKRLTRAVAEAGRDAGAKGDTNLARKHFASLKECGAALSGPDSLRLLQLVGQGLQRMADTEMAKFGPSKTPE